MITCNWWPLKAFKKHLVSGCFSKSHSFKLTCTATLSMTSWTSSLISIIHSSVIHSYSYERMSYVCTFLFLWKPKEKKRRSRLYHTAWIIFCIIGVHILNIITRLQINSDYTSCQKESNEFLHEEFTESKGPDNLLGMQPKLYTSSDVFSPLIHFHFIQIIFTGLHF